MHVLPILDNSGSTLREWKCPSSRTDNVPSLRQFTQNNLEAKKGLIAFPTAAQRSDSDNAYVFEEGEVYGFNVIVTDGDRAVRSALILPPGPDPLSHEN